MDKMNNRDKEIARVLKSSNQSLAYLDDDSIAIIYRGSNAWKAVDKAIDVIRKQEREKLIQARYINGADFVEWLKSKYADLYYLDTFNRMDVFDIAEALQEYMKGE